MIAPQPPTYRLALVGLSLATWLGGITAGMVLVGPPVAVLVGPPVAVLPPSVSVVTPSPWTQGPERTDPPIAVLVTPKATARPTAKPPRPTPPPRGVPPTPRPPKPIVKPPPPDIEVTCANGVDNGGGTGTLCAITIRSGHTTVRECHGAAGDPRASCKTATVAGRATSVDACNGSANGGGAVLLCSVTIFGGHGGSVRQCVGTGAGGTLVGLTCTANGAGGVHVDQCNGSANGGGALVVCSVRRR